MTTTRVLLAAAALSICACATPPASPPAPASAEPADHAAKPATGEARYANDGLLDELALLATQHTPKRDDVDKWKRDIASGKSTLSAYIDSLLAAPEFANRVAPGMVILSSWRGHVGVYSVPKGYVLQQSEAAKGAQPFFYLRKPCAASETVAVHPWWAPSTTVQVCPDSYRPTVFWYKYPSQHCSAFTSSPGFEEKSVCGCGPNLMRCFPSDDVYNASKAQLKDEMTGTISYVVNKDLPIEQVYLMNETFRKPYAEHVYQEWRVERGDEKAIPDLSSWPKDGKFATREQQVDGDHSGILTAAGSQWGFTGTRPEMRAIQETMWCSPADSSNVETDTLLKIAKGGSANLRAGEGWKALAAHPVCGNCHARLDYSSQFFLGFPDARRASYYVHPQAALAKLLDGKPTPTQNIYVDNIHDFRAQATDSPHGWAQVAVKQPEFAACQVRKVAAYVFGSAMTPEDRTKLDKDFEQDHVLRHLVKNALLIYAQHYVEQDPKAAPYQFAFKAAGKGSPASSGTTVAISPDLRADLDKFCTDCHDDRTPERDFTVANLPRAQVYDMLSNVAAETMPKTTDGIEDRDRERIVGDLVASLWTDPADRATAYRFFADRMSASTVNPIIGSLALVRSRAGAHGPSDRSMLESTLDPAQADYSPGFIAVSALEALNACRDHTPKLGDADIAKCVERATNPTGLIRP